MKLLFFVSLLVLSFTTLQTHANSLIELKKLTVGPFDNYQPDVTRDGKNLIFTRKQNQVPRLYTLPLDGEKSESATPIFREELDAVEAAFSPKAGFIAYVRLSNNTRGELCISASQNSEKLIFAPDTRCYSENQARISSPQWISESKIVYIAIPSVLGANPEGTSLWMLDLNSGAKEKVLTSDISSFRVAPNGNSIAWTKRGLDGQGKIHFYFLTTKKDFEFAIDLPGLSAFPNFAPDGRHLYFTHFLNDTNQDKKIDGDDHGVVFRIPLSTQTGMPVSLIPEPLTSVETSCVFPIPFQDRIAVTCGFDGSLDVYAIPNTGVIPANWNQADLLEAFKVSRHYHERILIMNALRYRYPGMDNAGTLETLLGLHFLSADSASTLFYVDKLIANHSKESRGGSEKSKARFEVFRTLLVSESLYSSNAELANQPDIQLKLTQILAALSKRSLEKFNIPMVNLAKGHLLIALGKRALAKELILDLLQTPEWHPLESHLLFSLALKVFDVKSKSGLIDFWKVISFLAKEGGKLSENSIHYTFRWLSTLQNSELPLEERISTLNLALTNNESIKTLLLSESISLRLLHQKEVSQRQKIYLELDSVMSKTHNDYFLSRAIYIRAILNFSEFEAFDYLDYVAGNWLKYTETNAMEFPYAKRQFAEASYSRAYFQLSEKNLLSSSGFFYSAMNLTDELEAHAGFVETLLALGQKQNLLQRYSNLAKRKDISEAQKYVGVLISLVSEPNSKNSLEKGISQLRTMKQGEFLGFRQLLMGSLHLKLALVDSDSGDVHFDFAHRYFNLALDLGRTNSRLKSSALMNMARLQQHRGYHNLAIPYFERRQEFPFVNAEEKLAFTYAFTRSLYSMGNYRKAAQTLQGELPAIAALPTALQLPFIERLALYKTLNGDYKEAIAHYQVLFKNDSTQMAPRLTYGLALIKTSEFKNAESILRPLAQSPMESPIAIKRQWIAHGLLAQISDAQSPNERAPVVASLRMRLTALLKAEGQWAEYQIAEEDWRESVCRNYLQLAFEFFSMRDWRESFSALKLSVQMANLFSKNQKSYLNTLAYEVSQTGIQILLHSKENAKSEAQFSSLKKDVQGLAESTLQAFQDSAKGPVGSEGFADGSLLQRIEKLKALRAQLF